MKRTGSRKDAKAQRETRSERAGDRFASAFASLRLCVRLISVPRLLLLAGLCAYAALAIVQPHRVVAAREHEPATLIETALFTRTEFFGAQALVPYPTAEARNRLADVQTKHPDEPEILLKLAQLDEKLGRADEATRELEHYVALQHDSDTALETLAAFYDRRAEFAQEAAVLERLLTRAPVAAQASLLRRLVELARVHRLAKYLAPEFYEGVIAQDPSAYEIIEQYIDKLIAERNNAAALQVLRAHKTRFPARSAQLLVKEAEILDTLGRTREVEQIYQAAFDPFWPDELSESFYEFLKDHDRFRAYGRELRTAFRRDPTNYDAAVRLAHFTQHAYETDPDIFVQLEKARAARGVQWQPEELATIARMLLAAGYADAASRFLYTLYLQGGLKPGGELRAKVLYQLFALLSDANGERLALTAGDLKFYQDIATADPHPGITGGILSLLFSDTNPQSELSKEEGDAVKYFNRAAAYRIFSAYKQEYPTAPELAQMYLDIVRLYTATGELDVAAATLAEFEGRYGDAPQFPEVALKLADCYVTLEQHDKEPALYQRILDHLGQHRQPGTPLVPAAQQAQSAADEAQQVQTLNVNAEPTDAQPAPAAYPPDSNRGIDIPGHGEPTSGNYYYYDHPQYQDHLAVPTARWRTRTGERADSVTYAAVLERYVAALARDERTTDILALYSAEIKKYPAEPGLYEQMLQWLGQTKLADEQLRVYQAALKQFPNNVWRDRMARWYLRRERKQEFAQFSRELLAQMNDEEAAAYLEQFVAARAYADAASFEAGLYLGLYSRAHERFPHNMSFVAGLLQFYSAHERWGEWRALLAEYFFVSRETREQFLAYLAKQNELRAYLAQARARCRTQAENDPGALAVLPYKLFRADAAAWLSDYEDAIDAYRELNRLYPNTPEYAERLIAFTRSLGQHNRRFLEEAAATSHALADAAPAAADYRTRAGELQAELGNYDRARGEWEQLITLGRGEPETYLATATVYWDYFQYADALRIIKQLRAEMNDQTRYAFQAGAILEAQHQLPAALGEYAYALAENADDYERAKRRLLTLYQRPGIPAQLRQAWAQARRNVRADAPLVLGYTALLQAAGQRTEASALLRQEITARHEQQFLARARAIFSEVEDKDGERAALKRLTESAQGPHSRISYRLQLAESYAGTGATSAAMSVLDELRGRYPTNYGVLSEAANFYWRLGRRAAALDVLRAGVTRGRGRFHYLFARRLAARELELNHTGAAERVLRALHAEDKLNTDVFHELARLYVRTGQRAALAQVFSETLAAIKAQDGDLKTTRAQVAELRTQMLDAFTRLKDYRAAVAQHIEIINRDPDDEQTLAAALVYVKRYGGGDALVAYYKQTAQQAYKNYRWNVVLARIYEANGDFNSAAANYRAALANQPEMLDLYAALADVSKRGKDYDGALGALAQAAELSNDDPQYIRKTVALLTQLGRKREAEVARQKLPPEPQPTPAAQSAHDQFAAAARLHGDEQAQAVAAYRQAFAALSAAPYKSDLRAADIAGYVQTLRAEEALDQIAARLWQLRERLLTDADGGDEKQASKARERLQVLDSALPEAVGALAAERATGDELIALFRDWQTRADDALKGAHDPHGTRALLQNLSRRAGLGALEEKILRAQKDAAFAAGDAAQYHARLHALVDFYNAAGEFPRIVELLDTEQGRDVARNSFNYAQLSAEYARLLGDGGRELSALRAYYEQTGALTAPPVAQDDALITRYFAALLESGPEGRAELQQRAERPSAHQVRLINFLLTANEGALAHDAIAHAPMPRAWQLARNAEASLALGETTADRENYFVTALQFKPIGELITQHPDTGRQLVGDDWFQLAARYGQWLYQADESEQRRKSRALLPALIENRPHDAAEQARLGRWYLAQRDPARALEHLQLALAAQPDDQQLRADIGAAYFQHGERERARAEWRQLIAGDAPTHEACALYLRTLAAHGLAAEARTQLFPILAARLKGANEDEHNTYTGDERAQFADYKPLLRALSGSFNARPTGVPDDPPAAARVEPDEIVAAAHAHLPEANEAQVAFFRALCAAVPASVALPELIVTEALVARRAQGAFYELLLARSAGLSSYERDYDYNEQLQKHWHAGEAEETLDHENDFKISEPTSARLTWASRYLTYLCDTGEPAQARALLNRIEQELKGRYARPLWLRLAAARVDLRAGHSAQAVAALKHLVGVETSAQLTAVKPPDTARLNEAVALLRAEGHGDEATELLAAAYTRALALAQYDAPRFAALARFAFNAQDEARGRMLLRLMIELGQEESRPAAEATLAAAAWLKPYAVGETGIELPAAAYNINLNTALVLAADTAATAGLYDDAINYRQRLRELAPADEVNRIELVRLLAAHGQQDDALAGLAAIIADRTTTRRARWQAVWLAPEIVGDKLDAWSTLRAGVAAQTKDSEMTTALEALALVGAGRSAEARTVVSKLTTINPNSYLYAFSALLEQQDSQAEAARVSLTAALAAGQSIDPWPAFGLPEGEAARALMRVYIAMQRPRAALRLAELDAGLQSASKTRADEASSDDAQTVAADAQDNERLSAQEVAATSNSPFQTLAARAQVRAVAARLELLGALSAAAEAVGEWERAAAFERARFALLASDVERRASAARIARLQTTQEARTYKHALTVDARFVARL